MSNERRKFHRVLFDAPTIINGQDALKTNIIDISLNGVLLQKPEQWSPTTGDQAEVTVLLDDSETTTITMHAVVTHQEQEQIGLRCIDIDMESISHLRRLIELNLDDPALLERDLESLG